ncbi:RHS repeat domain-containing protein [Flavobacterium covae]
MYGKTRKIEGDQNLIPFLYQGQYYDHDIELAYNRFRYYNPETGTCISQDPVSVLGGFRLYSYVHDLNTFVDVLGLMPLSNPIHQGHHMVPHQAATDLAVKPFNSQTGVPSMYFDDTQFTGSEHSAMHGYNGIGTNTKPLVKADQIKAKGLTNDQWLKSLENHYNNPALANVKGDLHIIAADGTKGDLIKKNVSPSEAWDLVKKWAKDQGIEIKCN